MTDAAIPTPEQLKTKYLQWMMMQNNSPRTLELWEYTIRRFNEWCVGREVMCVTEITRDILEAYRRYLFHYRNPKSGQPIKFSTQTKYLMSITRWFVWLTAEAIIEENPAEGFELPKEERRLPTGSLTADEVESVLNAVDVSTDLGIRNRAILETFYSTGIRCGELINLDVYDMEADRCVLKIRQGKGRKDRVVPIGERALMWIQKYLADVRPKLVSGSGLSHLFLSNRGRQFGRNNMSGLVKGYIQAAGINRRGSCHLFRHSAATLMMENGADLRSLQEFLGHERLTTTQIYTHVSIKRLQEVHKRTHPADTQQAERLSDSIKDNASRSSTE